MGRIGQAVVRQVELRHASSLARGAPVDEDALVEAPPSDLPSAAGLDRHRKAPGFCLWLAGLPNPCLAPHVPIATTETRNATGFVALSTMAAVPAGRPPIAPVS
jgi:lactate dehydrogenase-like 2-hydroxyacid dehydrogenase